MVAPLVIAALISAAASAGGGLLQSQQKNKEIALQRKAMLDAQASGKQQMKLAQMRQYDPYGNVFNPKTGRYSLTDLSRGILAAQQGEQEKALTTDATRNRAAREREDLRAREGEADWYNVLNEYRYGDRPSEAQSIADITREIMLARDKAAREPTEAIGRQAIRGLANPNVLRTLQRTQQEGLGGNLEEAILRGRREGKNEFRNDQTNWRGNITDLLSTFGNIAGGTTQASLPNVAPPSVGANSIQNMISALNNASTGTSSAMSKLASSTGQGGIGSVIAGLAPSIMQIGKYYQGQADAPNAADSSSWMVSTTPNQSWAMNNDVYGNPYPWAMPDVLEEDRDPNKLEFN